VTETLEQKRAEIEDKLSSLRAAPEIADLLRQADEYLAGRNVEEASLKARLAEIDAETGARERTRRAEAEEAWQRDRHTQRALMLREHEARLQHISDAQAACRALVSALDRVFATNARLAALCRSLSTDGKVPNALSATELESRMSARIASTMGTIQGKRFRLGSLAWPSGAASLYPANKDWREQEERSTSAALPMFDEKRGI
jgi:hypothetical protein